MIHIFSGAKCLQQDLLEFLRALRYKVKPESSSESLTQGESDD